MKTNRQASVSKTQTWDEKSFTVTVTCLDQIKILLFTKTDGFQFQTKSEYQTSCIVEQMQLKIGNFLIEKIVFFLV